MSPKSFLLTEQLSDYLLNHQRPLDEVEEALISVTKDLGGISGMQIAPEQGRFMQLLVSVLGIESAVEIGTFTGYSALQIARGMGPKGELLCCDVSEEWTAIARTHWEMAGVAHQVDLRIAPATETLASLPAEMTFDFAFIDADKPSYLDYYEAIVPRLRPNGVLLVDNVLWSGRILEPPTDDDVNTEFLQRFNDHVAADSRTESTILPIGDGLTFCRLAR
ncbi:MAG: O-methyltransferase [Actinomycetota bacterium]